MKIALFEKIGQKVFKLSIFPQKLTKLFGIILILIIFERLKPKFTNILLAQKVTFIWAIL